LIRRLGATQQPPVQSRPSVCPNAVASHLVKVAKFPGDREHERQVRNEWRQFCSRKLSGQLPVPPDPLQVAELDLVLKNIKSGTAAGYDNILHEFLKHMGPRGNNWLTSFFNRIVQEKKIPHAWLKAQIIAVPKPGKTIPLLPTIVQSHYCLCASRSWNDSSCIGSVLLCMTL